MPDQIAARGNFQADKEYKEAGATVPICTALFVMSDSQGEQAWNA